MEAYNYNTWNAKCPIFLGNFTPKTSNYCLKNAALGFPGKNNYDIKGVSIGKENINKTKPLLRHPFLPQESHPKPR